MLFQSTPQHTERATRQHSRQSQNLITPPHPTTHVEHAAAQALRAAAGASWEPGGPLEGMVLHPAQVDARHEQHQGYMQALCSMC